MVPGNSLSPSFSRIAIDHCFCTYFSIQETIEEEMRGVSFDSPIADCPSSPLGGGPADRQVVCCRPADDDVDAARSWRRPSAASAVLICRPASPNRRTCSVACLRRSNASDTADEHLVDRCAARSSMPNVRWTRSDAAAAAESPQCVCDATGRRRRTSVTTVDRGRYGSGSGQSVDLVARTAAAPGRRRSVERSRQPVITRSEPDMLLKLPPSSSEHRETRYSRPSASSLDRSRRQRGSPPCRNALQPLPLRHQ